MINKNSKDLLEARKRRAYRSLSPQVVKYI